jgi:hypothetical protein
VVETYGRRYELVPTLASDPETDQDAGDEGGHRQGDDSNRSKDSNSSAANNLSDDDDDDDEVLGDWGPVDPIDDQPTRAVPPPNGSAQVTGVTPAPGRNPGAAD